MKKSNIISLFILISILINSCQKDNTFNTRKYTPPKAIYDFPDNKLWKHRVNTATEAIEAIKEYSGVEVDVFFIDGADEFQTGHDYPGGISLDTYFDSIPHCASYFYWIDFKNLNNYNVFKAVDIMNKIINKHNLRDKIIVENGNADLLAFFKLSEIFTSYWIPDVSENLIDYFAEKSLFNTLESVLNTYQFDAVSAHYNMVSFMFAYLKKYNCHIWTNGLITESDKQKIINFSAKSNIKVILVDYEKNFLK